MKFVKKFIKKASAVVSKILSKITSVLCNSREVIAGVKAEGYVDSGVKILIAVVIGALLLSGLYTLFNSTIMPTVTQRIQELFNYKG